jgi:MurNAc alpha-1-phosphate uridylyltransferase
LITLTRAMLLAAGLGTRMRPLTEDIPKPLLPLAGRSLMDHALDRIAAAGVEEVVVNAHWHADQIAATAAARVAPQCRVVREDALLETGGGIRNALPLLGEGPFAVVNGDAYWLDGPRNTLNRLAEAFDPAKMDVLLLLVRAAAVEAEVGRGDFMLDPLGHPRRPKEREICPYLYGGIQVVSPALFAAAPEGAFSMNLLWDVAIEAGRCAALVHDGAWFHLSTPRDLAWAEEALATGLGRPLF